MRDFVRALMPSTGDTAATSVGLAAPFLMAAEGGQPLTTTQMILAAAATAAGGLLAKTLLVAVARGAKALAKKWLGDKDEGNDNAATVVNAAADSILHDVAHEATKDEEKTK